MKKRELINLGIPNNQAVKLALKAIPVLLKEGLDKQALRPTFQALVDDPASFHGHPNLADLAQEILQTPEPEPVRRDEPAPWHQWGRDLDEKSILQMRRACELPVSVAGALMPDAHVGYGLPIGGVLATDGAVVPYAVGVDIACRMKLTVLDMPAATLDEAPATLKKAIEAETRFGVGASFKKRRQHDVLDRDWSVTQVTMENKDKAWSQLGSSGSGNHFVEFGTLTFDQPDLGLAAGTYLALLSHSGSRGAGAVVCNTYSRIARELHRGLPKDLEHLAWLDLDSEPGQEYWLAMNLMGDYAAANHALIHHHIAKHLGAEVLLDIENHHNFAWKENHFGKEVVVHRKGATPAGDGVLGIIPGSMATPGFVVRGKGKAESLASASHGAGRVMSRKKAKDSLNWKEARKRLKTAGVDLMSAGLDEVPDVYKNIHDVMDAQQDLVDAVARFDPRIVKMAPGGRAED